MKFSVGCGIGYDIIEPTTLVLNVGAIRGGHQTVLNETLDIQPSLSPEEKTALDSGNRYLRLSADPGTISLKYRALVELAATHFDPASVPETPISQLPLEVMGYLNPSRYCLSDEMGRFANRQFGRFDRGFGRVTEICNWINAEVDYVSGTSDAMTTAADTFAMRAGVCRDFAHLGITFCRALGIPARFVSVYAWQLEPQDFHAVFEAYLGDRWYLFDATRMAALDGMVRIGCGRDAADTAFANIFGSVSSHPIKVWCDAIDGDSSIEWTTDAISVTAA